MGVDLIDGMTGQEFGVMMSNVAQLEEYVAQKCPASYVTGLEIGTMLAKAPTKIPDFKDGSEGYDTWRGQKDNLQSNALDLSQPEQEGLWSQRAVYFGMRAGLLKPLVAFEVRGIEEDKS